MHLVLNNYRSGSLRFSTGLARDTKLELYGDLFSDQSLHDTAFVEKFDPLVAESVITNSLIPDLYVPPSR